MQTERVGDVPLCDLQAQHRALQPQIEAAVSRVLASGQVILGPEVTALEREVADYCGTAYGVGCSSGSDAILLALAALGIGPGDEVIIPTFTFFATAGSVARLGATPVFCDVDPLTLNIDPEQVEERITDRTKAIMPVHLYGQCADMEPLWDIASRHDLPIIEDAAQAFGAEYQGKKAGTLGAICCLSFYPTKNLGTSGDAGLCVTGDPDWAARMSCLRTHGMKPKYYHGMIGWNGRIDAIHAAILRVKLPHVDAWIARRQQAADRYTRMIGDAGLADVMRRPVAMPDRKHSFNQYVVRVAGGRRDALAKHLQSLKIGCEIYYPLSLHQQECFRDLGYRTGDFPVSEAASKDVLALPMYPEIAAEQQERVIRACGDFLMQMPLRRAA